MKTRLVTALILALVLALSITPAFAQGSRNDKFCAGGNSEVTSGERVDNFALFGCNGTIRSGATVDGDVFLTGGNLTIENGARVNGDAALFGGNLNIAGNVRGNVAVAGGSLRVDNTAVIDGRVRVAGGSVSRAEGATIRGGVNQENGGTFVFPFAGRPFTTTLNPFRFDVAAFDFLRNVISAIALAVLGALVVVLLPDPTRRVMNAAERQPLPSYATGCLTMILLPILLVLFAITIIGIPVSLLLALAAAAVTIFGWIALGYFAGERILQALKVQNWTSVVAVVLGVLLLAVLSWVPCLGGVITVFILIPLAIGAVLLTRFGTRPYPYAPAYVTTGALPGPSGGASAAPYPIVPAPTSPTEGGAAVLPPSSEARESDRPAPEARPGTDDPSI